MDHLTDELRKKVSLNLKLRGDLEKRTEQCNGMQITLESLHRSLNELTYKNVTLQEQMDKKLLETTQLMDDLKLSNEADEGLKN